MATATINWNMDGGSTSPTSTLPSGFSVVSPWGPNPAATTSQVVFSVATAQGIEGTGNMSAYTAANSGTVLTGSVFYLRTILNVPTSFVPTGWSVNAARNNTNNNGFEFRSSQDNYATATRNASSTIGGNSATYVPRSATNLTATPISSGVLELRLYVWSATFATTNRVFFDNMTLTGTYSAGYTWSVWNGTAEVPATVQGVWNGTSVVPRISEERVP